MNWRALEQSLFESARTALQALLDQGVDQLYAVAFDNSYREEEYVLSLPSLAANALPAQTDDPARPQRHSFNSKKWQPVEWHWRWDIADYANTRLNTLDQQLQDFANRAGPRQWLAAEKRFLVTVARVARRLGDDLRDHPGVTADFIAFFNDDCGHIALAKRSISHEQFRNLFTAQWVLEKRLRDLAQQPEPEQAAFYLEALHRPVEDFNPEIAERWLIEHAPSALPELIERVRTTKEPFTEVRILGLSGIRSSASTSALRLLATRTSNKNLRLWCAKALGYLHDYDWLIEQQDDLTIAGFCAVYDSFRWKGATAPLLQYAPLERLLDQRSQLQEQVQTFMNRNPGQMDCTPEDLGEAIRGLGSRHPAIRRHAARVLNNRYLQPGDFRQAVQALRSALLDTDEQVRMLANLSLDSMQGNSR